MKKKEIRELKANELEKKLEDLKEEMFNLRFQISTNQSGNPLRIRTVRKSIARIKTILSEQKRKELTERRG